jgi:hypothetical protein
MHRKTLLIPKLAFITAWAWEGYGIPPAVIGMNENWLSSDTKRQFEDKVLDVLVGAGVAAGGTLTREFRETIAVLATGGRQFTAWAGDVTTGETGGVLVSSNGREAARLLRMEKMVRIDPVPPDRAAESLVDALPDVRPATINPVAVPKSLYSPNGPGRSENFRFDMPDRYGPRDPTLRPRTLMAGKRSGMHQLYAGKGAARSAPLTVVDVVGEGRLLTFVSEIPGQEPKIHFMPGSRQNLAHTLYSPPPGRPTR